MRLLLFSLRLQIAVADEGGYVNRSLPDADLDEFVDSLATRIWFVLDVSYPSNRFDIFQSKLHRCNQPQWGSVFDGQRLSIIMSCK